jgi:hypothetical protein
LVSVPEQDSGEMPNSAGTVNLTVRWAFGGAWSVSTSVGDHVVVLARATRSLDFWHG